MRAKEFIPASKPRNFVAKNQQTAGAGAHRDKKKEQKQGYEKHKGKDVAEDKAGWSIKGSPKPAPKGPTPHWRLNKDGTATDLNTGITYNRDGSVVKKEEGVAEGSKQLSVQQLATISDEALDKAYGYGRSTPGNSFGWQANLKSAAYAKQMIDKGVTDIEAISDAIHKGWNVTAQAFVKNPDQFDDTEKLRQAGKLEAKLKQRAQLMKQNYAQLPEEEKEKDRVVARALLQAIKGQQGVAEGFLNESAYEEAWELISQPVPEIQKFVKQLGLSQDDATAKRIAPMIDATPDTQLPAASIPKLKNLANKGNDVQTLKAIQQISGRPDAAQQYAKIMQSRDAGEDRKRGYDVSNLINSVKSGNYESPVLLKLATGTYVIGGRTRLYAALALDIPAKVKIISMSTFAKQGVAEGISVVKSDYDLDQMVITLDIEGQRKQFTYWDYDEDFENAERKDVFDQLQKESWFKGLDHPTKMEILDASYKAIRGEEPSEYKPTVDDEPLEDESIEMERVRDPEDWDEGDTEPPNNFAVYINGKKWKIFAGRGTNADDFKEKQHFSQLRAWAAKKSQETGKKWEVFITGEKPTE